MGCGEHALFGDLGVKNITKAHAIDVLNIQERKKEDTIAIGDAKVDIPMLEYCQVGVTMGNGGYTAMADVITDDVVEDSSTMLFENQDFFRGIVYDHICSLRRRLLNKLVSGCYLTLTEVMEKAQAEPILAVSHSGAMLGLLSQGYSSKSGSPGRLVTVLICHFPL